MRIVHVLFYYDEKISSEEELMKQYYTITGWAEALAKKGVGIIVVYRFHKNNAFEKNGVQYHFVSDSRKGRLRGWQWPLTMFRKVRSLDADVVHLHHLTLSLQTIVLRQMLSKKTGIVVQHHGGLTPPAWKRRLHNSLQRVADGFFFTTKQQGTAWFGQSAASKIMPVMEGATFFDYESRDRNHPSYKDKQKIRSEMKITGSPIFLWVGRLDENKDPLTILEGFAKLLEQYPAARLYMIYSEGRLLPEVSRHIETFPKLKTQVCLLRKVPHEQIEAWYSSADYFVLGSHYEGSGYALSEALKCGLVPIVTDIPSFRMMTNDGRLGALWATGDSEAFINAAIAAMQKTLEQERIACIDYYNHHLSFDAIAVAAITHYAAIMQARRSGNIAD